MATYHVEEVATDQPGASLVEAKSEAAALKHFVGSRFKVTLITSTAEAARLAASGVKFETADVNAAPEPVAAAEPVTESTPVTQDNLLDAA